MVVAGRSKMEDYERYKEMTSEFNKANRWAQNLNPSIDKLMRQYQFEAWKLGDDLDKLSLSFIGGLRELVADHAYSRICPREPVPELKIFLQNERDYVGIIREEIRKKLNERVEKIQFLFQYKEQIEKREMEGDKSIMCDC